jgi:hypothetical protein
MMRANIASDASTSEDGAYALHGAVADVALAAVRTTILLEPQHRFSARLARAPRR